MPAVQVEVVVTRSDDVSEFNSGINGGAPVFDAAILRSYKYVLMIAPWSNRRCSRRWQTRRDGQSLSGSVGER